MAVKKINEKRILLRRLCQVTGKKGSRKIKNTTSIKRIRLALSRNTATRDLFNFMTGNGFIFQKYGFSYFSILESPFR
jgi:hypothetical protein